MIRSILSSLKRHLAAQRELKPLSAIDRLGPDPLCSGPQTDHDGYMILFEKARTRIHKEIDAYEREIDAAIPRDWLDELALHTQIVVKTSELNYQHGRIVYAALRHRCATLPSSSEAITVFETGTARGFSALCMARALDDAGHPGTIITVDILPHDIPIFWNCIDDLDGKKSRRQLLEPWRGLLDRIVFLQAESDEAIARLALQNINLAFLDASHTFEDVMQEFQYVECRQGLGDVVVFDDVTPGTFPGVVAAVAAIEKNYPYIVRYISSDSARGYALATRSEDQVCDSPKT